MTIEPGWYVNYENRKQMRYHDGTQWTEHVHDVGTPQPATPVGAATPPSGDTAPGQTPTLAATSATTPTPGSERESLFNFGVLGLFVGLMLGGFVFNGVGAITPITDTLGSVDLIDIEVSLSDATSSVNRRSYVLSGTTDSGQDWRIVDEDAYNVLEQEGYPQRVIVGIGNWTDTAERVTGTNWQVDHQTSGERIGWGAVIGFIGLATLVGAWFISRSKSGGVIGAAAFVFFAFVPGSWLGYQAFQWVQSA